MNEYDYEYELTDDQLIYYSSLSAASKLRWLDEARRFTLLARKARSVADGGKPSLESSPHTTRQVDSRLRLPDRK